MSIQVIVSGHSRVIDRGTTLALLMRDQPALGVAVARNGEVVPRGQWATTVLADHDQLEIVRPVQGG